MASALIWSAVYVAGQLPGSTSTRPFIAAGLSSAACSGNTPDCECPITTAPFSCTGELRERLDRRVAVAAAEHVGHALLREFVRRRHRELAVGERLSRRRRRSGSWSRRSRR